MRVLVCIDLSPLTERIVEEACALARATGASFAVLHVVRTEPVLSSGGSGPPGGHRVPPTDLLARRERVEAASSRLRAEGVPARAEVRQSDGPASELIVAEAEAIGASHIMLGSHGHGRLYEALVGSVTQGVLRAATLPVIVVPARRTAARG